MFFFRHPQSRSRSKKSAPALEDHSAPSTSNDDVLNQAEDTSPTWSLAGRGSKQPSLESMLEDYLLSGGPAESAAPKTSAPKAAAPVEAPVETPAIEEAKVEEAPVAEIAAEASAMEPVEEVALDDSLPEIAAFADWSGEEEAVADETDLAEAKIESIFVAEEEVPAPEIESAPTEESPAIVVRTPMSEPQLQAVPTPEVAEVASAIEEAVNEDISIKEEPKSEMNKEESSKTFSHPSVLEGVPAAHIEDVPKAEELTEQAAEAVEEAEEATEEVAEASAPPAVEPLISPELLADPDEDNLSAFRGPVEGGRARIRVIGVGGAGSNSVASMMKLGLEGVEFLVVNTDVQALKASPCELKLQIGAQLTRGLGAGSDPEIGRAAAEEARDEIAKFLRDADMVFVTAGLGGGTGTGAAPVVAKIAGEMGVLSVGVCTKPFRFEGPRRRDVAQKGLAELSAQADTMIVVSNEKLLENVGPGTPISEAFEVANGVLAQGVAAISELVSTPGLINVDFADIRAILAGSGDAVMGIGRARGEQRATIAVNKACSSQLLEKLVIEGAKGILICVNGGRDLTLHEVNEAACIVNQAASKDANIIFGAVVDDELEDELKVTVLATGFGLRPSEKDVLSGTSSIVVGESSGDEAVEKVENGLSKSGEYSTQFDSPRGLSSGEELGNGDNGFAPRSMEDEDESFSILENEGDEHDIPAYKRIRRRPSRNRYF